MEQYDALRALVGMLLHFAADSREVAAAWVAFYERLQLACEMIAVLQGGLNQASGEDAIQQLVQWALAELPVSFIASMCVASAHCARTVDVGLARMQATLDKLPDAPPRE